VLWRRVGAKMLHHAGQKSFGELYFRSSRFDWLAQGEIDVYAATAINQT
jgi:hypothetical protein